MSRSADIIARLRREHAGTLTGSLLDELEAVLEQEHGGGASLVEINNIQRDEIVCLRAGLEAVADGCDERRVAVDTLRDADAIVREGGS